jgi:hypothetical protein
MSDTARPILNSRNIGAQICVSACVLLLPPLAIGAATFVIHPKTDASSSPSVSMPDIPPGAPVGKPFRFTLADAHQGPAPDGFGAKDPAQLPSGPVMIVEAVTPVAPSQFTVAQAPNRREPIAVPSARTEGVVIAVPSTRTEGVVKDNARLSITDDVVGSVALVDPQTRAMSTGSASPHEDPDSEPIGPPLHPSIGGRHHGYHSYHGYHGVARHTAHNVGRGAPNAPSPGATRLAERNAKAPKESWLRGLLQRISNPQRAAQKS